MKFSNLLFISMFRFKKNAFGYLLACIEIFIIVILLIYVLSTIRYYNIPINTLEKVESSRLINYTYNSMDKSQDELIAAITNVEEYAKTSTDISRIGRSGTLHISILKDGVEDKNLETFYGIANTDNPDQIEMYSTGGALAYDPLIAEKFPLTLEKGEQLKDYKADEGCVPAILHSKFIDTFDIGDIFTIRLQWTTIYSSEEYKISYADVNVQVAGFLNKSNYHTVIGAGGSFFTADMLVTNEFPCEMIILHDDNAPFPVDGYTYMSPTILIEVSEKEGALENVINELSPTGFATPLGNVIDDSIYMLKQQTAEPIINLIILIIVAAAAIGGINGMNQISQKKDFAVYFICGATWSECIKTDILRNVLIISVPAVLSGLLSFFLFRFSPSNVLSIWDFVAAVGVVAAIYLISSLWYIISLKKMKPADSVKEWEN